MIFRKADFISSNYSVVLRNDTSSTFFLKAKDISLCSLAADECLFSLPKGLCQKGHTLTLLFIPMTIKVLNFFPDKEDDKGTVMVIGRVEEIDDSDASHSVIRFRFTQWVAKEWQHVWKHYERNQSLVSRLLRRLKD